MEELPFVLVIISAMAHGSWNFLFKQAENKDAFLGLSKLVEPLLFLGPFLFLFSSHGIESSSYIYVVVGAVLSIANYLLLANAYKRLDLALAYPISRSSTIFLPFLAYLFFSEVIDLCGWLSVLTVSAGVIVIQLQGRTTFGIGTNNNKEERWGLFFAILAAFTVALYTLWGRVAVNQMHPLTYMYLYTLLTCIYFIPSLIGLKKSIIVEEWQCNWWRIIAVAFLNTFSYVLMLFALKMSKVAYVGALRQLSLVFGVTLGWLLLKEHLNRFRIGGLGLIVVGAGLSYFAK